MPIHFFTDDVSFRLKGKTKYKQFIAAQFLAVTRKQLSLNIIFCSDEALLKINRDFLQHDYYTDIITFPLSQHATRITAEMYISIDRVRENAILHQQNFEHELLRVIFHGILHLAGYGDKTAAEKKQMRTLENAWIKAFVEKK